MGKVFSLVCLILIILTSLKFAWNVFIIGLILNAFGITGLVVAMLNFRDTSSGQPVTKGVYRISRHPQLVALFVLFFEICIANGSWIALLTLITSRVLQHHGILAEQEVCLT
jgi:protein-S-isoprenylcysteine O-methyltransferase Ste14